MISMNVLSGSSSRALTSIGPEMDAMAVVAPEVNVAEPSARGRRERVAVMVMVFCVVVSSVVWASRRQDVDFELEPTACPPCAGAP